MKDSVFLIVAKKGVVRMSKRAPVLKGGEVSIRLAVSVPDGWFNMAVPKADVSLPEPPFPEATVTWDEVRDESVDF